MVLLVHNSAIAADASQNDTVVLLHGLARTHRSMSALEDRLKRHGFHVVNIDYPSRKHSVETLALLVAEHLELIRSKELQRIHFVTHSLGGIIVRWLAEQNRISDLGRVVMLAPPNKGSNIVDTLKSFFPVRYTMGPAFDQLGTVRGSLPLSMGPVAFELGVIAGEKTLNPLFSHLLPGKDDGKVTIESTKVDGMSDFLTVSHSHGFIMQSSTVGEQVVFFLKNGRFNHDP